MKNIFLLSLLISTACFSQKISYATGGRIFDSNNEKIKPSAVRELMKKNETALASYNAGRTKKTVGNILFYGGIGLAAINLVSGLSSGLEIDENGNVYHKKTKPTLAIIGGAMVLTSIPVKIGYTKKIKNAIYDYNSNVVELKKRESEISILANNQGMGIRISF